MTSREPEADHAAIARAFVSARRHGAALVDYPGTMPTTLAEAYVVQDIAIGLTQRSIAGWKLGRINPPVEDVDRLAGPIFDDQVYYVTGAGTGTEMPVIAGGFAAAEAEFLLRIGTAPDPAKHRYSLDEAQALIGAVHVGIEIASSPFLGINAHGPTVTVSDFGNNNGLLVGPEATGWRTEDINHWQVELSINGKRVGSATSAKMLDGPFGAAGFLFEHMAARGIALSVGQWISSGAVTGVHQVAVGDLVEARFDNKHTVICTIKAQ